ncbi:MAG: hypothetical protein LBB74_08715 [Chitinispirillales bacterium]|jgi:hypothetical protein|nr:hypothetical protein [Chitinispirillales bacterium]
MMTFAKKRTKYGVAGVGAALAVLTAAAAGWAADITVCKATGDDACMFKTVQEAVNAARPGQVIEIMDTETYEEQVTIDGRGEWNEASVWDQHNQGPIKAVKGGKNGITIKYAPTGARLFGTHARPTIKWKDVTNRSPNGTAEAARDGELTGTSGNFETCGALRIIRAQGVTIDGIKVDGGGQAPFENKSTWGIYPLFHGNAALTIVVSGGAVIRNCDITNGYFGINVKDRNTGGVFGNPNPNDNDRTIPLSGFGKVGNHIIEYNKIHNNVTGIFFESAWDLGSTVRYNLIYSNIHQASLLSGMDNPDNSVGGAILFKDMKYTPVAIYNNTFYNNSGNILGGWKIAAPHLLFNNIFGKPSYAVGARPPNSVGNAMFEHRFPYRMHNTLFSATADLKSEKRYINQCKRPGDYTVTPQIPEISGQELFGITQVRIDNNIPNPPTGPTQIECIGVLAGTTVTTDQFIAPGGLITGTVFEASANIRWLETSKSVDGTEDLFVSVDPASSDFLRPKWEHALVTQYIKNKGWTGIGMKNSDGADADIGAISSTGRAPATVARVKPSNVVLVTGTSAKASFFVTVESGQLNNAKISFLRWVAPLPTNPPEPSGNSAPAVPKANHHQLTAPAAAIAVNGNNTLTFTIPALPTLTGADSAGQYGFFEVVVSGTDAAGNPVASDIGFLPYRKLEYTLKMEVFTTAGVKTATVNAGEQYRLQVTPCKGSDPANCGSYTDGPLSEVSYELQSDAAAFMYTWNTETPFTQDGPAPSANITSAGKSYNVYFTRAGAETIMASGVANVGGGRLVFLGTADITVRPGAPDHLIFTDPIPLSQLGSAPATVINRGVDREVTVKVEDKWGNAVDVPVQVTISSNNTAVGDVGAPGNINTKTVTTTGTTGVAEFVARTAPGAAQNQTFDMTATAGITGGTQGQNDNVGRLRVGRALDRLEVFYSDNGPGKQWQTYYDPTVTIDRNVGEWAQIAVKVLVGDTVNTGRPNQFVLVSPSDPNLVFSATEGGAAATVFPLTGGVATFWVGTAPGTDRDISNAGINVYALRANNADDIDASIASGGRENINFNVLLTAIEYAVVYGDGQGRPDSLRIRYLEGGVPLTGAGAKPNRVTLTWSGVVLTAEGAAVSVVNDVVLGAKFTGDTRPTGKTSIGGVGAGLVKVYGGSGGTDAVEEVPSLYDGVGPVLANGGAEDGADGSAPLLYENVDNSDVDTIVITFSEDIRDVSKLTKLLYKAPTANPGEPSGAVDGVQLTVLGVTPIGGRAYKLAVRHTDDGPIPGGWLRLNPGADAVADNAATQSAGVVEDNRPHDKNRWVKLNLQGRPPTVKSAWYTASSATGKPNYAYVEFSKDIDDLSRWFSGGSVKFDAVKTVSDVSSLFAVVDGATLRIDLSAATDFASPTSTAIRTSGDMQFTLTFGPAVGEEWGFVSDVAADRAKPVLALGAELKTGSPKGAAGEGFNLDTLVVYYSESISATALAADNPVTLRAKGGKYSSFEPELRLLEARPDKGFYMARYLVVNEFPQSEYPESGDSVHICHTAQIGDSMVVSNVQDSSNNKWQPLTVKRASNWKIMVGSNPFVSDASGAKSMGFVFDPRPRGVTKMTVKANIKIFDNLGALVMDTTIDNGDGSGDKMISWKWRGENKRGRLVGTGTYLLRATCESKADGDSRPDIYKVPTQMLGVVRGKR